MLALLVDLGWKSALIAGFALLANHLLRRRAPEERVASLRAALAALLMLPLLAVAFPEFELAVLPALAASAAVPTAPDAIVSYPAIADVSAATPFDWLSVLYWTAAGLLLLRLAAGLFTLWHWTHTAAPVHDPRWTKAMRAVGLRRPVRLLVSPRVVAPMSWGLSPAWVLIGPDTEQRIELAEAVVAHELAHVRRFDWPVLVAAQLATLFLWFNPLVWLLARELARQTELAADEEATHRVARADYAQTLLSLAGRVAHPAACGMSIKHSALGRRICCVLDADAARPASRLVCAAMLISAPLAAAPLAAMQLVPATAPAPAPTQVAEPLPAPAVPASSPAIIPAARVAGASAVQPPRSSPRQAAPMHAPRPVDAAQAKPRALLEGERAGQVAPRHAGHTPPPPRPPAPTLELSLSQEAKFEARRVQGETRARNAEMRRVQAVGRTGKLDDRDLARVMTDAAKGLRVKAQDLEAVAADGSVVKEVRDAHARAAGSLRNQADKLDIEARRKLFGG